jgi:hypothetical protein
MADIVFANADTWITETLYIRRGEMFYADDPAVTAHPASFTKEPPADMVRGTGPRKDFDTVEQATAAPGERRGRPRG